MLFRKPLRQPQLQRPQRKRLSSSQRKRLSSRASSTKTRARVVLQERITLPLRTMEWTQDRGGCTFARFRTLLLKEDIMEWDVPVGEADIQHTDCQLNRRSTRPAVREISISTIPVR